MNYPKAKSFDSSLVEKPGPNPILLTEELFQILEQGILEQGTEARSKIPSCMPTHMTDGGRTEWSKPPLPLVSHPDCLAPSAGSVGLDLGSGTGITSVMLAREYGFVTYAADLWSDPSENMRFFESMGLCNREIVPVKVDVQGGLPFAHEFFDSVVSIDSYNYFGRDALFLDEKLLPYVKHGGLILLAIPGMKAVTITCLRVCLNRGMLNNLIICMISPGGERFSSNRKVQRLLPWSRWNALLKHGRSGLHATMIMHGAIRLRLKRARWITLTPLQ